MITPSGTHTYSSTDNISHAFMTKNTCVHIHAWNTSTCTTECQLNAKGCVIQDINNLLFICFIAQIERSSFLWWSFLYVWQRKQVFWWKGVIPGGRQVLMWVCMVVESTKVEVLGFQNQCSHFVTGLTCTWILSVAFPSNYSEEHTS